MEYYVHNFIGEENGELRSYHKSFYYVGKRKRLVKRGRSKTTYFENYGFKTDEDKILAYLHSIDKSLNFIFQDCFNQKYLNKKKAEAEEEAKNKANAEAKAKAENRKLTTENEEEKKVKKINRVILKADDTFTICISKKEVVELMGNWNNKKYRHESIVVNREFFKVIQSIRKILKVKKFKFEFKYISSDENEAAKLIEQYQYQFEKRQQLSEKNLVINKNAGKFYDKNFKTSISIEDKDKLWNKLFG